MSVTPEPVLAAEDLRVVLGGAPVLRGVTITVSPGEALALLGGNGSGKSTFLRASLGLVPTAHGEVSLFGTPLRRFRQWRRIGYVPQRTPGTVRGATVSEVVALGRLSVRVPFQPAGRRDREAVRHALARVDLLDRRHHEIATLSGGQQQRVLIARALVGDPDILVLDEPTAGVDLAHQQVLAELVQSLIADGRSMLVVLHELGALGAVITRTVTLRGGRVVPSSTATAGLCHDHPRVAGPLLPGAVLPSALIGAEDDHG